MHVHQAYVEQLETGRHYDVIVSGLPFANFAPEQVELIMDHYLQMLRPGGTLTYFAYRGTRVVRALLASRDAAARHRAVEARWTATTGATAPGAVRCGPTCRRPVPGA